MSCSSRMPEYQLREYLQGIQDRAVGALTVDLPSDEETDETQTTSQHADSQSLPQNIPSAASPRAVHTRARNASSTNVTDTRSGSPHLTSAQSPMRSRADLLPAHDMRSPSSQQPPANEQRVFANSSAGYPRDTSGSGQYTASIFTSTGETSNRQRSQSQDANYFEDDQTLRVDFRQPDWFDDDHSSVNTLA